MTAIHVDFKFIAAAQNAAVVAADQPSSAVADANQINEGGANRHIQHGRLFKRRGAGGDAVARRVDQEAVVFFQKIIQMGKFAFIALDIRHKLGKEIVFENVPPLSQ